MTDCDKSIPADENVLQDTITWFKTAGMDINDEARMVQLGVHVEEFSEMFEALGDDQVSAALHVLANHFKNKDFELCELEIDRRKLLDAMLDQIVTACGVGYMFGLDIVGGLAEVNRSNYSKFVDGVAILNEQGKIAKGPNYTRAELDKFVGPMP